MVRSVLTSLTSSPFVYDVVQRIAGNRSLQRRLQPHVRALVRDGWIVDIGGGTGLLSPPGARYVCLDLDRQKLRRFLDIRRGERAVAANAAQCPLKTGSMDAVLCTKVTHHLDDRELAAVFSEIARVTKPGGTLVIADAVRSDHLTARLLWRFDGGAHPRAAETIRLALPKTFAIERAETFRLRMCHEFAVYVARKRADG